MRDVVSVERVIAAPADRIFALLADPHRHHEFDGSGTVRKPSHAPDTLALGSEFGMNMHFHVPYAMKSRVIELEQDRRLAWQTLPPLRFAEKLAAGRIWRYELEPVEGGTLVRESWDISKESPLTKPMIRRMADATAQSMARSLERIEQIVTTPAP
jgi:uncharacterized protein YndB with AHSA1/START domain